MKTAWLFSITTATAIFLLLLTGCVGVVPVPERSEAYGRPLHRADVAFIHVGKTTRSEIITKLGTNYASLPYDHAFAYTWETRGTTFSWWFVAAVPDAASSEHLGDSRAPGGAGWNGFFIAFDTNGCVSATQFKHLRSRPLHSQLDDWFRQLPPEPK